MAGQLVFKPIRIGAVEVSNRIVRTAHSTMFSKAGVNDDLLAYHLARAKAGVGLSIIEAAAVHPTTALGLRIDSDEHIDGYRRLVEQVAPTGMKLFQQLWHGGHHYPGPQGQLPWGCSTIPSPATGLVPIAMGQAEIDEVVEAFATGARRCEAGGLDGVEVHAAHGYLPHQFLSPHTNDRADDYGGSLENRMRFLREILAAVRGAVSEKMAVGVRLSASTLVGGINEDDLAEVARRLEADGLIDYLNVSWGDYYESNRSSGAMDEPVGYELQSSAKITAAVSVPRIIAGRYRTIEDVEQTLRDGSADLVSMVRAQIADPDLVRKSREGNIEGVRPCIACNQACLGGLVRWGRMGCVVNPAVGFETTLSEHLITPAAAPRRVLVVGGGPAGMEAARTAALAGHRVKLVEASPRLGGAIDVARRAPRAHTIGDIIDWQEHEIYRLGVEVALGSYFTGEDIRAEGADVVIIATGSLPRMDGRQIADPGRPAQGVGQRHVLSSHDLITATPADLGKTALVLDDLGHFEAMACAELLINKGLAVTYVTRFPGVSPALVVQGRIDPALRRLMPRGLSLRTRHHLVSIGQGECVIRPLMVEKTETVAADTVVLVTPNLPLRDVYDEVRGDGVQLRIVGDANAPRDLQAAIREGHMAGRTIQ